MKDKIKEEKYEKLDLELVRYRKYMCSNCDFYQEEKCTKNRVARICAKKGLKNK